jgi:hypothetical protein
MQRSRLVPALALCLSACDWISLAANAATYDTLRTGDVGNVVVVGDRAYATLGEQGILIRSLVTDDTARIALPPGIESADDVATADGLLFVLDARPPGHVASLSLATAERPVWQKRVLDVPVGPFSGISAREGLLVVSGGTSLLTLWRYGSDGLQGDMVSSIDLGRGQPDVLLGARGVAYVSTHYRGPHFGIDVIRWNATRNVLELIATLPLEGAGFTAGGSKPANFPIEMALANDSTLLVAHARGVAVIDVRDPRMPTVARIIDVGGRAVSVDADSAQAVVSVAAPRPGIQLVTWGTGRVASHGIALPPGTNPAGIAFTQRHILLAARDRGLVTWSRPTPTQEISR